jgi:hypothetical protein
MLWVDALCINQCDNQEKAKQIRLLPKLFQGASMTYAVLDVRDGCEAALEMLMQVRALAICRRNVQNNTTTFGTVSGTQDISGQISKLPPEYEDSYADSMSDSYIDSMSGSDTEDEWPDCLPMAPLSWRHNSIPPLTDPIWNSVRDLFSISWFRRVWIIQETVASSTVTIVCGKWMLGWEDLRAAMEVVERELDLLCDHHSLSMRSAWAPFMALAAHREWEHQNCRGALLFLLESSRHSESTLKRDRLFALLGLASDGNEEEFEPDYDSSLENVVFRFASVFIRQGRGIQMLHRAGLTDQADRFPSWVPDWTVNKPMSLQELAEGSGGIRFSASGPTAPDINLVEGGRCEISVAGFAVDILTRVSESSNTELEWSDYFQEVDKMVDSATLLARSRYPVETLKWKLPIACVEYPKVHAGGSHDLPSSYQAFRKYLAKRREERGPEPNAGCLASSTAEASTSPSVDGGDAAAAGQTTNKAGKARPVEPSKPPQESAAYVAALEGTLRGWRFAVTERGQGGVVPSRCRAGDMVAVFKGGSVPFVLRRSKVIEGAFRLVGECYVHGMMSGEGLMLRGVKESRFIIH